MNDKSDAAVLTGHDLRSAWDDEMYLSGTRGHDSGYRASWRNYRGACPTLVEHLACSCESCISGGQG